MDPIGCRAFLFGQPLTTAVSTSPGFIRSSGTIWLIKCLTNEAAVRGSCKYICRCGAKAKRSFRWRAWNEQKLSMRLQWFESGARFYSKPLDLLFSNLLISLTYIRATYVWLQSSFLVLELYYSLVFSPSSRCWNKSPYTVGCRSFHLVSDRFVALYFKDDNKISNIGYEARTSERKRINMLYSGIILIKIPRHIAFGI